MLGKHTVGKGYAPYVIAEIGANHNGDMALCRRLIDAAVESGAHAVKFQSWTKSSVVSKAEYQRNTSYSDTKRHFGSLEEMVERYQLSADQHREVRAYCSEKEIEFLSTAFTREEVDLLESLEVVAHKVASMDVNNLEFLSYLAATGKPVMLSTGMASIGEIERALEVLEGGGAGPVIILHCVSIYPPEHDDINLRNIPMLAEAFESPVGFSDHTIGTAIPLASVALGACVIEKHFTLDRQLEGWDHWISATPEELREIVEQSALIQRSLGRSRRVVSQAEIEKRKTFRRCIVVRRDLSKGHVLEQDDLDFKRPGTGINPDETRYVVGRTLKVDIEADHELAWTDLL